MTTPDWPSHPFEKRRPFDYHTPGPDDLEPYIGRQWAICRDTPANRERYGRCLTKKQYAEAQDKAITARGYARPVEKVIRDLIDAVAMLQGHTGPAQHEKIGDAIQAGRVMLAQARTP